MNKADRRTCVIPLTKGRFALVDARDHKRLSRFKWFAKKGHSTFYALRSEERTKTKPGRLIQMHRQILGFPPSNVDHINRRGLDNRRCNLRLATRSQNLANSRRRKDNTSGFKGVSFNKEARKWHAQIKLNGTSHYLGDFIHIEDAALTYQQVAKKFFGDFARPSNPRAKQSRAKQSRGDHPLASNLGQAISG